MHGPYGLPSEDGPETGPRARERGRVRRCRRGSIPILRTMSMRALGSTRGALSLTGDAPVCRAVLSTPSLVLSRLP